MTTLFSEPKTITEARSQANIAARAETLFTTGGYSWYIADTDPYLFGVCSPDGQQYAVNMKENTCSCQAFPNFGDCKHRIAVANNEDCYDASLIKQYELSQPF